jgi:hypothetical protein
VEGDRVGMEVGEDDDGEREGDFVGCSVGEQVVFKS